MDAEAIVMRLFTQTNFHVVFISHTVLNNQYPKIETLYLKYKKGECIIIVVIILVVIIIIVVIHEALVSCFSLIFSPDMVLCFEAWGLLNLESKRSHPPVILSPWLQMTWTFAAAMKQPGWCVSGLVSDRG